MTAPGQADEYTPRVEAMRQSCISLGVATAPEFDRFLAARDRAVREAARKEALEEAAQIAEGTVVTPIAHVPNARATRIAALLRAAANQTGEQKHAD